MVATKEQVEEKVGYVSQLFMNISGFVDVRWKWDGDNLVIYNGDEEGSPSDDMTEAARLVAELTGWEVYEITNHETYNSYGPDPFMVGLRKPTA